MAKEIEVKILDADQTSMRRRLEKLGAKRIRSLYKQKRYVFDISPGDKSRWIRLRSDGLKNTLAVKIIKNDRVDGTLEYETEVSDVRATLEILRTLGFKPKSYQENYREDYLLGTATVSLDYWPKLQPYIEIEAVTKKDVASVLSQLNLEKHETTSVNTKELYARQGIDLDKKKNLIFSQAEERAISQPLAG
jgi:adenylate cyclase class 2